MVSEQANTPEKEFSYIIWLFRLNKHKLVQRIRGRVPLKTPRKRSPREEPRLRRSPGPRSRLRKSLTTPFSSIKSNTREWSRRCQKFFASPEPFFARSSRLEDLLPVPSSRTCTSKAWSNQSANNTPVLTFIWDARPKLLLRKPLLKLRRLLPRPRRSDQSAFLKESSEITFHNLSLCS